LNHFLGCHLFKNGHPAKFCSKPLESNSISWVIVPILPVFEPNPEVLQKKIGRWNLWEPLNQGSTGEKAIPSGVKKEPFAMVRNMTLTLLLNSGGKIAGENGGQDYFSRWKWTPDLTIKGTFSSMDGYLNGLHSFFRNIAPGTSTEKKC
jgi:hypothetical protein